MRDEIVKYKTYTRRAIFLAGLKIGLISLIAGRYYYLQMVNSEKYKTLAEQNRIKVIILPALRGHMYDRNGLEIANNTVYYRLGVDPYKLNQLDNIIERVEKVLDRKLKLSRDAIDSRIQKKSKNEALLIEDNLTWEEISRIAVYNHLIEEVDVIEAPVRHYPHGDAFAHISGYIGAPTEEEVENLSLLNFNELRIGKSGLEKILDEDLRGYPGIRKTEVNVRGRYVREISKDEPISGNDVKLTIDAELQKFVSDLMIAKKAEGAVVVMDAKTGGILAMHSSPSFDPNEFVDGVSKEYWQKVNSNPSNPLINNVISTPYPPGSTFKIITALAGLSAGIDPKRTFHCGAAYSLGSHVFKCMHAHGSVNCYDAIARSCNVYFYNVASIIGVQKIADTARKLGYDAKTGIELPFEHPGSIPDPAWKQKRFKMEWYKGDTINTSIGQGYVLVTPIQMATMTARVATGKIIKPTLILRDNTEPLADLDIDPKHLETVRIGLRKASNEPGGTSFRHQMSHGDFIVGGKTGTAQVAGLRFHNKGKFEDHSLFTSFAPVQDPKYVISVVYEHGGYGAVSAVPLTKEIYNKLSGKPTMFDPREELPPQPKAVETPSFNLFD